MLMNNKGKLGKWQANSESGRQTRNWQANVKVDSKSVKVRQSRVNNNLRGTVPRPLEARTGPIRKLIFAKIS